MIVISPHLDDAVLSCGQLLAAHPRSTVITVFAGVPPVHLPLTDFDKACGFDSGAQAVSARREEDRRACAVLDATPIWLDLLDAQYREGAEPRSDPVTRLLHGVLDELDLDETLVIPLGIVHPDHLYVARAARLVGERSLGQVLTYEELPGRVLWPEATELLRTYQTRSEQVAGPMYLKEAAIACYRSQTWALDRHACLVPERYWEVS